MTAIHVLFRFFFYFYFFFAQSVLNLTRTFAKIMPTSLCKDMDKLAKTIFAGKSHCEKAYHF